eukprot:562880-Amphidinium_carterae.1
MAGTVHVAHLLLLTDDGDLLKAFTSISRQLSACGAVALMTACPNAREDVRVHDVRDLHCQGDGWHCICRALTSSHR